jgi:hypothetical protein
MEIFGQGKKTENRSIIVQAQKWKKLLPESEYDTESIRDEMKRRQYLFFEDRDAMETLEKGRLRKLLSERENDIDYMIDQLLERYPRLEVEDLLNNYVY